MTASPPGPHHDKRACGGKLRNRDGHCTRPAGWGTPHPGWGRCKLHGGCTATGIAAAQREAAEAEAERWGLPVTTTAVDALASELDRTFGRVLWLAGKVTALDEDSLPGSVWPEIERWERRHLSDLARGMVGLDLTGRQLSLLALFGERLADALDAALSGAGVTAGQRARVLQLLPPALERRSGA